MDSQGGTGGPQGVPVGAPGEHRGMTLELGDLRGRPSEPLGSTAEPPWIPRGDWRTPGGARWSTLGAPWDHLGSAGGSWGTHGSTLGTPGDHLGSPRGDRRVPGGARGVTMDPGGSTGGIRIRRPRPRLRPGAGRVRPEPSPGREGARRPGRAQTAKTALFAKMLIFAF